jgi:hypothetical protein
MPRKPVRQSRYSRVTPNRGRSISARTSAKRLYHQCLACGAQVDPMFGLGDGSWCPSCRKCGEVYCAEGELPDPQLYGNWLQKQEEAKSMRASPRANTDANPPAPQSQNGDTSMKHPKLHSGIYCCPDCCIEFDLMAEESLKCDRCGGALIKGTLEDLGVEEDEGDAEHE